MCMCIQRGYNGFTKGVHDRKLYRPAVHAAVQARLMGVLYWSEPAPKYKKKAAVHARLTGFLCWSEPAPKETKQLYMPD